MARDAGGRYAAVSGQREDFAPELPLERYWNRKDIVFKLDAADTSEEEPTEFETGMEIEEQFGDKETGVIGRKWVLRGAFWQPLDLDSVDWNDASAFAWMIQLLKGSRTTMEVPPSELIVGQSVYGLVAENAANGCSGTVYFPQPLDIITPVPIFQRKMTIVAKQPTDHAGLRGLTYVMSLIYGWADAYISDIVAEQQILQG